MAIESFAALQSRTIGYPRTSPPRATTAANNLPTCQCSNCGICSLSYIKAAQPQISDSIYRYCRYHSKLEYHASIKFLPYIKLNSGVIPEPQETRDYC